MSRPLINAARIAQALAERTHIAWLRYTSESADRYIREAHRDGIINTETLREWARQRDEQRAQIAALETRRLIQRLDASAARGTR